MVQEDADETQGPVAGDAPEVVTLTQTETPRHAALRLAELGSDSAGEARGSAELPQGLRGRFEKIGVLGQGGMGTVLRVRDLRLGREVALKLVHGGHVGDTVRFLREARAQARISHENVCAIYDAGEVGGQPYIVMQAIDGETLTRALESMSLEEKIVVVRDVAAAVHEAHRIGLIHRDLKPGNILVERRADGSPKPYVVDFGLARETREEGHTATGAVLGTPAYMAPEQARGEIRALDRRTDVYSLGAVLFELVTGRPPFVRHQVWETVLAVIGEEAPKLRSVKKGAPKDLETIVMKCLEKEPERRYESARALAEDLQRFLDGEPILARKTGAARAVFRLARKHRLATALLAGAVATALSLAGVWVKGQRDAAEQARIGEKAGEDAKEMEMFLREAYGLPLHDVERERAIVRRRLDALEVRVQGAGAAGRGAGHYALGRGYLALGEPARAREHLEKARDAGYSAPELWYALGQALGELYVLEKERAERLTSEADRKKKEAALAADLRDPALAALRVAAGAELSEPAYVEGLIAHYQGDEDLALSKARDAFGQAPWLYEAKKLEGDALMALGDRSAHDAAVFDLAKMRERFEAAAEAYRIAADIARSDPGVPSSECRLWTRLALAEDHSGNDSKPSFQRAIAACDRAVAASSSDGRALSERAFALIVRANVARGTPGADTVAALEEAQVAAQKAVDRNPEDVLARYDLARTIFSRENERFLRGLDAAPELARKAFQDVLALDPRFLWAVDELGDVDELEQEIAESREEDPTAAAKAALAQGDAALSLDPSFPMALTGKLITLAHLAQGLLALGRSPEQALSDLLGVIGDLEKQGGQRWYLTYYRARAKRLAADWELRSGRDPRPLLAEARALLESIAKGIAVDPFIVIQSAEIDLLDARYADANGEDATELLRRAREEARQGAKGKSAYFGTCHLLVRVELAALRRAVRLGKAQDSDFESAFEPIRALVLAGRLPPVVAVAEADIHALRARWLIGRKKPADADITAGLEMVERALRANPQMASALATRKELRALLPSLDSR